MSATCSIDGCSRSAKARGWCHAHYMRWYETGEVGAAPVKKYDSSRLCSVDGCDNRYSALGYCAPHYKRVKLHGTPGPAEIRPRSVGDDADYTLVHHRVRAAKGRAREYGCVRCPADAAHWAYDHQDPNEKVDPRGIAYSLDVDRYVPMCASCHKRFDLSRKARLGVDKSA